MNDEMSNKQFNRVKSNAQAEAGLEHRKLREEIERLKDENQQLEFALKAIRDCGDSEGRFGMPVNEWHEMYGTAFADLMDADIADIALKRIHQKRNVKGDE